jgi:6-phosphogluconolactonase
MGTMNPVRNPGRLRAFGLPAWWPLVLTVAAALASEDPCPVFVGTYTGKGSEGIYHYRFSPATGEATPIALAAPTQNPSFLAVDSKGRFLYAVNELNEFNQEPTGAVSAFAIDRDSGKLNFLQQISSLGAGPAHLSLDKTDRFLLVANYNSGNYAVFPVGDDGRLGTRTAFLQDAGSSVNKARQAGPHAHSIQVTPDNRYVLVADLGIDKLLIYRLNTNTGSLAPCPSAVKVTPGAGPRHVAFAPSAKFVYLVCEMGSTVTVLAHDSDEGALREKQTVSTLPKDFSGDNRAAEIVVDASGKFLYVSNRGHDSIVVFSIVPDSGSLAPVQWIPSGGKTPRQFAIDPTGKWLWAANHNSNNLQLFQLDPISGRLALTTHSISVADPVCVVFAPVK